MNSEYKLSFTSASLFLNETIRIAELYWEDKNWNTTKDTLLRENTLQRKKDATTIRQFQEIRHRLKSLTDGQLELLINSGIETQRLLLFLGICKVYSLIREFTVEIVRHKFILFDRSLNDSDYYKFYEYKSASSTKLSSLKEKTKEKVKRVTFTILWQSGIINSTKDRIILQPLLTPKLVEVIVSENPELLKIFLVSDTDIKNYKEKYVK